jgi:lipoprotein NlpI
MDLLEFYNKKGLDLVTSGKNEEAIECFNKVLELNPENEEALNYKDLAIN